MSDIEPNRHATFLEYVGIAGATKECQEAIERLLPRGACVPTRFWDYIVLSREDHVRERNPWKRRGLNVPMAIIDDRLAAMARDFWKDPDGMLFKGYRLLEETIREKAGITDRGGHQGAIRDLYDGVQWRESSAILARHFPVRAGGPRKYLRGRRDRLSQCKGASNGQGQQRRPALRASATQPAVSTGGGNGTFAPRCPDPLRRPVSHE